MIVTAKEAYGFLGVGDNYIISDTGAITFCYLLKNPACYSLTAQELEERHNDFFRAFKKMPDNTIVHKQDVFLRKQFDASKIKGNTFIQRAEKEYFNKKTYLEHYCILSFSLKNLGSLKEAYIKNPFAYKESLTKKDKELIQSFMDAIEAASTVIRNMCETTLIPLSRSEIQYFIFNYANGLYFDNIIRNPHCGDDCLTIDDKKGAYFAITNESHLPDDDLQVVVKDESLPNETGELYASMFELLGVHFKYTHVVNQFWEFNKDFKTQIKKQVKNLFKNRDWDKEIDLAHKELAEHQVQLREEHNILCKHSFNVFVLEEERYFDTACNYVKNVIANQFYCEKPSRETLYNIHRGSVIGAENKLSAKAFYLTDLHSSLCLTLQYSTFQDDETGIFFNERIYNTPFMLDIWDRKELKARNIVIVAGTGGGKSVMALNIVQQYIEQGIKVIIVEFGKSFYQLTQLYPDISLHVDYDGSTPLGINPFKMSPEVLTNLAEFNNKIKNLTNIVLKFMRSREIKDDAKQVISLRRILKDYYDNVTQDHSFISFYNYVKTNAENIYNRLELTIDKFDLDTFLHNCKEFLPGGIYEMICKESEIGKTIENSNFIVFELTRIKDDPFLVSVIMSILSDTIEIKLYDKENKGIILFDEYAETAQIKDIFDDKGVHSTVAFNFQKLRKENSAAGIIIQMPSQLPDDEFTKNILGNTQVLIVLPTTENIYKQVINAFAISTQKHINLMRSIRSDLKSKIKFSEVFIRFMDLYAVALRLELSPTKFLAFQTEADITVELQKLTMIEGSLEKAITKKLEI